MSWLPLDYRLLRVGLYIKIDHAWKDHPFVRSTFTVSSPTEIVILQQRGLTNLLYDPERSHADAVAALQGATPEVQDIEKSAEMLQDAEADEQALLREKHRQIETAVTHRDAIRKNEQIYNDWVSKISVIMAMMNVGQADALHSADKLVSDIAHTLEEESIALSLVCTDRPIESGQELAMHAINVSVLAGLTAKHMGLCPEEVHHAAMGGLFHNIGMNRVPLAVRVKNEEDLSPTETKLLRMYPQLGKEILEAMARVPTDVVEIVYQHREYLDGTGYPKRLINGDISKLARLVGVIIEYDAMACDTRSSQYIGPSRAMSWIYKMLQNKYGLDVIEQVIAAMTVFPPGSFVQLNEGMIGLVLQVNSEERLRPVIMLYDQATSHETAEIIDLTRERSLVIEKSLDPKTLPDRVINVLTPSKLKGYILAAS